MALVVLHDDQTSLDDTRKDHISHPIDVHASIMYQSILKPLIPPGNPLAFDSALAPYSGGFDQKGGPPGGEFDFPVKTSVSGRKQKNFAILCFST